MWLLPTCMLKEKVCASQLCIATVFLSRFTHRGHYFRDNLGQCYGHLRSRVCGWQSVPEMCSTAKNCCWKNKPISSSVRRKISYMKEGNQCWNFLDVILCFVRDFFKSLCNEIYMKLREKNNFAPGVFMLSVAWLSSHLFLNILVPLKEK